MLLALLVACRVPAPPPSAAVSAPARGDAVYFALVDRFADGRPDAPGTTDPSDLQAWHGGDLAGLIARLDHLDALGFGAVWISPVTASRQEHAGKWGAYHGYWMLRPDAVEPRFGTADELRALSDGLHARGMRLILDVVVNHVGYDAPVVHEHPDWFHGLGDITDWHDAEQVVTHDVHGLPDLALERPEVAAWLTDGAVSLVQQARPDALRIDAVRHVPAGFLAGLGAAVREGSPDLQTLGEVFDGNPARLGERVRSDDLDAVFDFPLMYGIMESGLCVEGAGLVGLATNLFTERHLPAPRRQGPLAPLVTLLDNHDVPRLASGCARPADALALMYGLRGTPSVTWGTEVPLDGAHEPDNRRSMPWDAPRRFDELLRTLNGLRASWPALREGDQRLLSATDDALVIARSTPSQTVVVAIRRTEGSVQLPGAVRAGVRLSEGVRGAWSGEPFVGVVLAELSEPLPPDGPVPAATVTVDGPEGVDWAVVGTAPELGAWDAGEAVPVVDGVASVPLPAGTASAVKLLRKGPDGVSWSQTADVLLVAGGSAVVSWVDAP